jgi:hypothetical protein
MINWFKKEKYTKYKDKLRDAFPKALRSDVDAVLSILPFDDNNAKRTGQQIIKVDNLIFPSGLTVHLDNEMLSISYRIYQTLKKKANLTTLKKQS